MCTACIYIARACGLCGGAEMIRSSIMHQQSLETLCARATSAFASASFEVAPIKSRTNNPTCLIWVYWTPPNYGYLKQSVDGSSIQNPAYAGLSGVFHNWMGEFVLGYERAIHVNSKMTAEMWALRDGLWVTHRFGFSHLIVETDSIFVYNALHRKAGPSRPAQEDVPKDSGSSFWVLHGASHFLLSGI